MEATCFDPLYGHHQNFFGIKSVNAAYMLGSQLCLQTAETYLTIELRKTDVMF